MDLTPTTSVTLTQVVGDCLAIALMELRGFKPEDFRFLHPGGVIGRAASRPVRELMHAGDALPRGIADGQTVRVFNDRGTYVCKAVLSPRARPGVVNGLGIWWRKLGLKGTNVNELTHQKLTDIGRAPSFYDCLVEVKPAALSAT